MTEVLDLLGQTIGVLKIIKRAKNNKYNRAVWFCRCECGTEKDISSDSLRQGKALSCGCLGRKNRELSLTTHSLSKTSEYRAWQGMKTRCYTKSVMNYKNYGGRGIKVCDRWLDSVEHFVHDMGKRPSSDFSIDRIDNDGNYEPNNCRWATRKQQMQNTRVSNAKKARN